MSGGAILYLVGMGFLFGGLRLFAGGGLEWIFIGLGALALIASLGLRAQRRGAAPSDHHRAAHGRALKAALLGCASLLVYLLSTDGVVDTLGLEGATADRWSVPFQVLWPILWLAGTLPLIASDLAIQDSPRVLQPRRIAQAMDNWLAAALALALVFPLNWLAAEHNTRWDLAYFKTTAPGTATQAVVANLKEPVEVRLFQPTSSEVTQELLAYFNAIDSPNLKVEVVDHAAEPALTKELKIRGNGYVALTLGELTKTWKVGDDLDSAKRNLKKLDTEFHKKLIELAIGKQIAYLTTGHGEMNWKSKDGPDRKASTLKKILEIPSYRVKELGLTEGLGEAVPDDAGLVMLMGPTDPLLPGEIRALKTYIDGGGAVLIALDPDGDPLEGLLSHVGLRRGEGSLASEAAYVRLTGQKGDRLNVVTNRFSSHESTATLSKNSKALPMAFVDAAWLEEIDGGAGKVTITVRSMADNWADLDGDLDLDKDEKKKIRPLAAVAEGAPPADAEEGEIGWRVAVVADSTAFSDLVLANVRGNQQYIWDVIHWLTGDEESTGTTESEEDVKIQHTKEDQVAWFYSTSVGVPFLVLLVGWLRVRSRRKGGSR